MRQRSQSVSTLPTHSKSKQHHHHLLFKKNVHAASRRTSPAVNSYNHLESGSRGQSTSLCSVDQEHPEDYDDQHVQAMSHRDQDEEEKEEDERAQHKHHHNSMAATPIRCQSPISQVEDQIDQLDQLDQSEPPLLPPPPPAPQRRYRQRSHSLHPGLLQTSLPSTSASTAVLASAHLSGYKKRLLSIGHLLLRRPSAPSLDSSLSPSLDR
jgi:hypothetical protein